MNGKKVVGWLGSLAAMCAFASTAQAQQEMAIRSQGVKPYTAELAAVVSGAPGLGLGAEIFFMPKVAAFVTAAYLDANVPDNLGNEFQEDNDQATPDELIGTNTLAGVRWYAAPQSSSWYAGAGLGYADSDGTWDYQGEKIDVRMASVLPTLQAGYRVLLENNVLIRLGAGAQTNDRQVLSVDAQTDTATALEGEEKVRDAAENYFLASVDLGLGYAF